MIALLKSSRFQGLLVIGILQSLVIFNVLTSEQSQGLIQIIQAIIAGAIAVRSVDRLGDKKVEAAAVTVS